MQQARYTATDILSFWIAKRNSILQDAWQTTIKRKENNNETRYLDKRCQDLLKLTFCRSYNLDFCLFIVMSVLTSLFRFSTACWFYSERPSVGFFSKIYLMAFYFFAHHHFWFFFLFMCAVRPAWDFVKASEGPLESRAAMKAKGTRLPSRHSRRNSSSSSFCRRKLKVAWCPADDDGSTLIYRSSPSFLFFLGSFWSRPTVSTIGPLLTILGRCSSMRWS